MYPDVTVAVVSCFACVAWYVAISSLCAPAWRACAALPLAEPPRHPHLLRRVAERVPHANFLATLAAGAVALGRFPVIAGLGTDGYVVSAVVALAAAALGPALVSECVVHAPAREVAAEAICAAAAHIQFHVACLPRPLPPRAQTAVLACTAAEAACALAALALYAASRRRAGCDRTHNAAVAAGSATALALLAAEVAVQTTHLLWRHPDGRRGHPAPQ